MPTCFLIYTMVWQTSLFLPKQPYWNTATPLLYIVSMPSFGNCGRIFVTETSQQILKYLLPGSLWKICCPLLYTNSGTDNDTHKQMSHLTAAWALCTWWNKTSLTLLPYRQRQPDCILDIIPFHFWKEGYFLGGSWCRGSSMAVYWCR